MDVSSKFLEENRVTINWIKKYKIKTEDLRQLIRFESPPNNNNNINSSNIKSFEEFDKKVKVIKNELSRLEHLLIDQISNLIEMKSLLDYLEIEDESEISKKLLSLFF